MVQRTTSVSTAADPGARMGRGAPISAALAVVLGALVLLAVLTVIAISTWTGYRNTVDLLRQKADIMVSGAIGQLRIHLQSAERQAAFVAASIESGIAEPADRGEFVTLLSGALAATPHLTSIAFVDPDLRLTGVQRDQPSPLPVFSKLDDDNVWQAQARQARQAEQPYWAGVVWRGEYDSAQLSHRRPVLRDGEFFGFVNVEVDIAGLSELIGDLESDFGVNAFILQRPDSVVAHPMMQFGFPDLTRARPMPSIRELGDPVLMGIWDAAARNDTVSRLLNSANGHAVDLGNETYVFVYHAVTQYGDDWLVGSYLPAASLLIEIERLFDAIIACAMVVLCALLLAAWLGRRISRPVRVLAEESRRVRNLEFDDARPVPGCYIREVNDAAAAFNQMVEGLRERQLIRDLFGRYVPKSIVNELLRDKGKLQPRSVEATVLFVDLANFTALSEDLAPRQIVDILNAYFAGVSTIIERHRGIITQFQGDAILAVFNLPIADPDHARHAVASGIEIRKYVNDHRFNHHQLSCRIGINTGELIAGNVGGEDRVHYTVHGDTVNLAARLDDLNKELGTTLLVSAATVAGLQNGDFAFHSLGKARIRGKSAFVEVFEIA